MLTEQQKLAQSVRSRKWYLANKELVNKRARESRARNPEQARKIAHEYYQENKERKLSLARKWIEKNRHKVMGYSRKCRYNITPVQFESMYLEQKGLCAVCNQPLDPPNLDHDHLTNTVRALLCGGCNRGLGHFKDSPELLRKAADYVERHQAN